SHPESSLEAEPELGPAVGQAGAATFPQRAVGAEQLDVPADDRVEVRAADLLLALDDPPDPDRKLAVLLAERPDDRETNGELTLVVARAAREQLAVALRRFEGRRLPEVERVARLDVVVVVEQEREVSPARLLSVHRRCSAVGPELPRLEPRSGQQFLH